MSPNSCARCRKSMAGWVTWTSRVSTTSFSALGVMFGVGERSPAMAGTTMIGHVNTMYQARRRMSPPYTPMPSPVPIWKTIVVTIHASTVRPKNWSAAHFHEPLSRLVTATVAMHGEAIRANNMMQNPTRLE